MIAKIVTNDKGEPINSGGTKLAESAYQPPEEIKKLFAQVQIDYQTNYALQQRPFREFDGVSLLERARLDQETFGAYVGAEFVPEHKAWRWRGRKNTARNMVIGILAHVIAGMLFPYVNAYNEDNEQDEMTAKVMRILVENHLKKAGYELKFLFMMTSALVNPAVFVEIEYVQAMQRIKTKLSDGTYKVDEAIDELLSGLNLNIRALDEILLGDFFTFDTQRQPNIIKVRRISYDEARKIYAGKYVIDDKDQFEFVQAGQTRVLLAGQPNMMLYDIDWTEADANFVQEITVYYRAEDLEVTFVGGVFLGNYDANQSVYNTNPFKHRRMSMVNDAWTSIPVYPFAKTGFEPLDPNGRFAYYKSATFKEFWDDASQNRMYQLAHDGTYLDVIKPMFLSGVAKIDQTVMVPGATVAMPTGATATPYQLGPNIRAALDIMRVNKEDQAFSTQDPQQSGNPQPGVTATAALKAEQNAKIILGVFGVNIADLIKQIGELTMDCIIMHTTVGEIDATIPESLRMKFKPMVFDGKEGGKDVTNNITFSTDIMDLTPEKANEKEWALFDKSGGMESNQRNYIVNPFKFARQRFSLKVDPDQIVSRSMGTEQIRKDKAYALLMDPRVMPYIDQAAVVDDFVLKEYTDGDPDKYKRKVQPGQDPNALLNTAMGQPGAGSNVPQPVPQQ